MKVAAVDIARQANGVVTVIVLPLVASADADESVRPDVALNHAINEPCARVRHIVKVVPVLTFQDEASSERAVEGERPGDVDLAPVVVPGTDVQIHGELVVVQGTLAVQAYHPAGIPAAPKEAVRSSDDLHIVEFC